MTPVRASFLFDAGEEDLAARAPCASRVSIDPPRPVTLDRPPRARRRRDRGSEQIQIFALLPGRDVGLLALLGAETGELGLLDMRVVIDKSLAESVAETGVAPQRRDRLAEIFRQRRGRCLIGRIGRRPR